MKKTYLSELRSELPTNCLFDKGRVGCGGTTLAIESNKPYVICVPFSSLVRNKVAQYPNERFNGELFGVEAGVTVAEIKEYVESVDIPKIVTTYDSLYKVTQVINPAEYSILIDEYHILFTQYSFRAEAIKSVLNDYKLYKEFCFMTATPIEEEFILEELKDIPVVRQDWNDTAVANVVTIKCTSVMASTARLIEQFLNGDLEGNAYLFLNSTKAIKKLVEMLNLNEDNTRVIYSKHSRVDVGIERGTTLDEPKKINFLTSTAFEGSDIYDEEGRIFIISDPNAPHSLLDISTSIQQIAGRIRNSKYYGELVHLYSVNRYISLNYEDFKASQEEEIKRCSIAQKEFNELSEESRICFNPDKSLYLIKNKDNYVDFDVNLVKVDTFNYKVATSYTLRISLDDLYKDSNYSVLSNRDITKMKDLGLVSDRPNLSFKDVILLLEESNVFLRSQLIKKYAVDFPILPDAYNKLGIDRIKKLKYVQKDIKAELYNLSDGTFEEKVIRVLKYQTGQFISLKDIKSQLGDAYSTLKSKLKAKGSDIEKYYDVKEGKVTVNGKRVKGYYILRAKDKVDE